MVGPAEKTPRMQLTPEQRRLCLEAQRRERRAEQKDDAQGKDKRTKKASRKKPMKLTTASMEVAEPKGVAQGRERGGRRSTRRSQGAAEPGAR
ncbi:hypothetical protein PHMEG_00036828 [Phytophthora megakarya]|uniref:Uncharacterized protein n=1 Tax=Phytophthora megakarya TaxID=4795 RepID=A0A225UMC8_9STRA|nr:hypothetical protein PHMEG_00036828 [Phytophthora megakarya]